MGSKKDQTEKILKQWLTEEKNYIAALLDYHPDAIFIIDVNGKYLLKNIALSKILAAESEDVFSLVSKQQKSTLQESIEKISKKQCEKIDITLPLKKEGDLKRFLLFPFEIKDKVIGVYGILSSPIQNGNIDVDPLTGLPNRRLLIETLEKAIQYSMEARKKLAILFIDIDRFKIINNTLGHVYGDRALVAITNRLKSCLDEDAMLARMGGDEFIILLPDIENLQKVKEVATNILAQISKPLEIDDYEFTLTSSIGISFYPDNGNDAEGLIKCADAAMFRAKGHGIEKFQVYTSEMSIGTYEWFRVENDLRKALKRNEFELYFQPQFHTETKEICGMEVLVRWRHPKYGVLSPAKFIAIAEETGLIVPLGEWVLKTACTQVKQWFEKGFPQVPLSVNLSLRQFMQKNIVFTIRTIMEETNFPPHLLDLEITESVTIDIGRTMMILEKLKELGVKISLDDFGTGYSSLQYLSELPIDELKIDQSFVQNLGVNNNSQGIIKMIINLGKLLNVKIIAEGVETEEQFLSLKEYGCDTVQGYYFSKPLSKKEYETTFHPSEG